MAMTASEFRQSYDKGFREGFENANKMLENKIQRSYDEGYADCREIMTTSVYPWRVIKVCEKMSDLVIRPTIGLFNSKMIADKFCDYLNTSDINGIYVVAKTE